MVPASGVVGAPRLLLGWPPTTRLSEETINVRWGDTVTLRVRETRHGPVIDDFIARSDDLTPQGHVLALQAVELDRSVRLVSVDADSLGNYLLQVELQVMG